MSPMKPRPPCAAPGCPGLAEPGRRHCVKHASVGARERAESQQRYDSKRGTAAQRGYNARWRRLRKLVLGDPDHAVCEWPGCNAPATVADHIVPKKHGGKDEVGGPGEESNIQGLCATHHAIKTRQGL